MLLCFCVRLRAASLTLLVRCSNARVAKLARKQLFVSRSVRAVVGGRGGMKAELEALYDSTSDLTPILQRKLLRADFA